MQGDYLPQCLVPVPIEGFAATARAGEQVELPCDLYDLVIVTQSCDLLKPRKPRFVALSPIYRIAEFEAVNEAFKKKGKWNEVLKGRIEGLHLLASPEDPANNQDALVVDFREVHSLPFAYLSNHASEMGSRWRLRSPYLEHFSQNFARFFMRVGLPSNIPAF